MKRRTTVAARTAHLNASRASTSTGEHCPATGWWIPEGTAGTGRFLSEGNLMPAVSGTKVSWLLAPRDSIVAFEGAGA